MKYVALISASKGTAQFPDKLLAKLKGKPIIQHTYESVNASGLFEDIIVVTNHDAIEELIKGIGGDVIKTNKDFDNSLERLAEASLLNDGEIFVCIPGDHLRLNKPSVEKLMQLFEGNFGKDIKVASIVQKVQDANRIADISTVKVALSLRMYGLYLSRAVIPLIKNHETGFSHFEHVNIIASRKEQLMNILQQPASPLERAEQIECLRFIENGVPVKMVMASYPTINIGSMADIPAAEAFIGN
jgi:CMP-2-keto-3-deoxyoctulosonic acid synthetase